MTPTIPIRTLSPTNFMNFDDFNMKMKNSNEDYKKKGNVLIEFLYVFIFELIRIILCVNSP